MNEFSDHLSCLVVNFPISLEKTLYISSINFADIIHSCSHAKKMLLSDKTLTNGLLIILLSTFTT